jgi:hypothetical protein
MKTLFALLAFAGPLFIAHTPCLAQPPGEIHQVRFAKGASSATLKGSISGDRYVDYKLRAGAGQTMNVALKTTNLANYFNVLPPGSKTAIFIGSTSGEKWTGTLPVGGEYTIRVYLMRSAARRNEHASYALTVGITGQPSSAGKSADAKVAGTPYHATGQIPCTMTAGQSPGQCPFGVQREGNGGGIVTVTKPDGRTRAIFFAKGKATGYDFSQADRGEFKSEKKGDMNIIHIGPERYEIPDAAIFGG